MANAYDSLFTGEHNDEYDTRIRNIISNLETYITSSTTVTNALDSRITDLEDQDLNTRINTIENLITIFNEKQNITSKSNTIVKIPETISTTATDGMQTVLSYIATHYPGYTYSWFLGEFSQSGNGWFFIMVYDTSALTDGIPNYAWGMAGMVAQGAYPIYAHKDTTPRYSWFSHTNYGFYKSSASAYNLTTTQVQYGSITITTHGRPVFILCSGDMNPTAASCWMQYWILRDGVAITTDIAESHGNSWNQPFSISYLDRVAAGTYTYSIDFKMGSNTANLAENGALHQPDFIVFEI